MRKKGSRRRNRPLLRNHHLILLVLAVACTSFLLQLCLHVKIPNLLPLLYPTPPLLIHRLATQTNDLIQYTRLNQSFCAIWDLNVDDWWTYTPNFELAIQNTTHQCFREIKNADKAQVFTSLSHTQYHSSCHDSYVKLMSNSGWAVDLSYVVDGLLYAHEHKVPVIMLLREPWQYAAGRNGQSPVCPSANLDCYMLPLTNCKGLAVHADDIRHHYPWRGFDRSTLTLWMLEYATRGQTWLRKAAVELAAILPIQQPCTVFHVRRADVVLHGKFSRRYHAIQEYIQAAGRHLHSNILLLSDDQNAIQEALNEFPNYRWIYWNRTRHKGPQGGWENQIPSNDPAWEVVVLMATFLVIPQCNCLVHTKSNLADYLYATMIQTNPLAGRIDMDKGRPHHEIHAAKNAKSVRLSRNYKA